MRWVVRAWGCGVPGLIAVAVSLGAIACGSSPSAPTAARGAQPTSASAWTIATGAAPSTTFALCPPGGACVGRARFQKAALASSSTIGAPVLLNNQPSLTATSPLSLSWTAPAVGTPINYIFEVASVPGGPVYYTYTTGNALTSLIATADPNTYYVRLRAIDSNGEGPPSNEVQVIVTGTGGCPSAPGTLLLLSQVGGTVTIGWHPPATGVATSYWIAAGSSPGASDLVNHDLNSNALTLTATNVGPGTYYVRVHATSTTCPSSSFFLSPPSNEITVTVPPSGTPPPLPPAPSPPTAPAGWSGQIVCQLNITGPNSYFHNETQKWVIGGAGQVITSARTNYPTQWSASGSGGATGKSWTISTSATTDFSATVIASTGLTTFGRTTTTITIPGGIVGTPISFTEYEITFPSFATSSPTATSVSVAWSRPTIGGDSPQQPSGSTGTLSCTGSLTYR